MSTENDQYSYVLPSMYTDSHHEPASLAYMGAAKLLRKMQPDGPLVDSDRSVQMPNGDWILKDIFGVNLAIVNAEGKVQLVDTPAAPVPDAVFARKVAVATHGYEVHEEGGEPVLIPARLYVETRWSFPNCKVRWKKVGSHLGAIKKCRQCGHSCTLGPIS